MIASPSEAQKQPTNQHNMENRIALKIDVTKIDKSRLYEGKKGVYLDCLLMTNRDGESKYGDDGFIIQSISAEARAAGERGPIVGNWRYLQAGAASNATNEQEGGDKVPF
jgi:hypothetical protein